MKPVDVNNEWLNCYFSGNSRKYSGGILAALKRDDAVLPDLEAVFPERQDRVYLTQEKTGYCWLISALHCIADFTCRKYGITNVSFSKNYLIFWDKIEKANWFLEHMLCLLPHNEKEREVRYLLDRGMSDRGEWNMARNLIEKYGLIPYEIMEDSPVCSSTGECNACVSMLLRRDAYELNRLYREGVSFDLLRQKKEKMFLKVTEILCSCFGTPPVYLSAESCDGSAGMTPSEFYHTRIGFPFDEYVCIYNDGEGSADEYGTDDISLDGNVVGGQPCTVLRVNSADFYAGLSGQISDHVPCWFTCDAGKFWFPSAGIFDDGMLRLDLIDPSLSNTSKNVINQYRLASMSHAMLLTDTASVNGTRWWRAADSAEYENCGHARYLSDGWLKKYVFQAAVRKQYLPCLSEKTISR